MTYPHPIALIAPAPQSGKTTAAVHLKMQYGYTIGSFAAPGKHMVGAFLKFFGYDETHIIHYLTIGKDVPLPDIPGSPTTRHLIKTILDEWGRHCVADDVWARRMEAYIDGFSSLLVIDDARHPEQYDLIRSYPNSRIWRIIRPGFAPDDAHASEGALDDLPVDAEIINDGSVDDLKRKIDSLMRAEIVTSLNARL